MSRLPRAQMRQVRSLINAPLEDIAAWVAMTCLTFGTSVHTAYCVAGIFVAGVERERQKRAAAAVIDYSHTRRE